MVSGNLVLNRGSPEWWSFYDIDASDAHGCGKLSGPMAIIVSEETPRKLLLELYRSICSLHKKEEVEHTFSLSIY